MGRPDKMVKLLNEPVFNDGYCFECFVILKPFAIFRGSIRGLVFSVFLVFFYPFFLVLLLKTP